jgi:hypothetical protein
MRVGAAARRGECQRLRLAADFLRAVDFAGFFAPVRIAGLRFGVVSAMGPPQASRQITCRQRESQPIRRRKFWCPLSAVIGHQNVRYSQPPTKDGAAMTMADETDKSWQMKDALLFVPLIASSLAISWEVGRFIPFGGFRYFTLSEHLLAAMGALPYALVVAALLPLLPLTLLAGALLREGAEGKRYVLVLSFLASMILSASTIAFMYYLFRTFIVSGVLASLAVLWVMANAMFFRYSPARGPFLLLAFGTSIFFTMVMARDVSLATVDRVKQGVHKEFAEIVAKSGTSKAYVIMAGERGLLLYSPDTDRVSFQRADEIQKIEWQR